jgi:hypothetical protein
MVRARTVDAAAVRVVVMTTPFVRFAQSIGGGGKAASKRR